jgi:hypothetical protein
MRPGRPAGVYYEGTRTTSVAVPAIRSPFGVGFTQSVLPEELVNKKVNVAACPVP